MATVHLLPDSRAATSGICAARARTPRRNAGVTSARTALMTSASITVTSMKILVTGGAGFIGSHVADAYIAAGYEVAILDDFSTGSEANVNREAKVLRIDVRNKEGVAAAIAAFRPEVVSGLNVLKASVDAGARKVVFSSTGGALYGEPDVIPADEDHPVRPLSPYGTSKLSFEHYLGTFHRTYGLEYTVLRYANIYGPRQDFHAEEGRVIAIFASRMIAGKPVTIDGDGEQARDMLHVADVAVANIHALYRGAGGTYHVSTGIPVTINELFRKLTILTDYKLEPNFGPRRKGDVFRIALDNTRARNDLDWEPKIDLEEGLSQTVEYFRHKVLSPH